VTFMTVYETIHFEGNYRERRTRLQHLANAAIRVSLADEIQKLGTRLSGNSPSDAVPPFS